MKKWRGEVLSKLYCCYGNLLYHENNIKGFTSDWDDFHTIIVGSIVVQEWF